jgi:hypothetical protein
MGIRDILRVETRKRNDDGTGIGFHGNLVRLADVDEKIASLRHSLRDVFRRQIVNLVRHLIPPNDPLVQAIARPSAANVASHATKIKRRNRF